jgi:hypothetical protein
MAGNRLIRMKSIIFAIQSNVQMKLKKSTTKYVINFAIIKRITTSRIIQEMFLRTLRRKANILGIAYRKPISPW